jgi:hypothetical protein
MRGRHVPDTEAHGSLARIHKKKKSKKKNQKKHCEFLFASLNQSVIGGSSSLVADWHCLLLQHAADVRQRSRGDQLVDIRVANTRTSSKYLLYAGLSTIGAAAIRSGKAVHGRGSTMEGPNHERAFDAFR